MQVLFLYERAGETPVKQDLWKKDKNSAQSDNAKFFRSKKARENDEHQEHDAPAGKPFNEGPGYSLDGASFQGHPAVMSGWLVIYFDTPGAGIGDFKDSSAATFSSFHGVPLHFRRSPHVVGQSWDLFP